MSKYSERVNKMMADIHETVDLKATNDVHALLKSATGKINDALIKLYGTSNKHVTELDRIYSKLVKIQRVLTVNKSNQ